MKRVYEGMSNLEREFELEMDDELEADEEAADDELEADEEADAFEMDDEAEADEELENPDQEHVERFLEIASREFESESEADRAMNEALNGVATEYLFGKLWKRARKFGSKIAKNSIVRSLVKKGLSVASGQFPALKAALALAKGDLQGTLLNLGKQALATAIPGSGAALSAIQSLGFQPGEEPEGNREAWENYVQLSREAFEHLADNVTQAADTPLEASRLASQSFQHALKRAQARARIHGRGGKGRALRPGTFAGKTRVVRVQPGQRVVILGARRIIVKGA